MTDDELPEQLRAERTSQWAEPIRVTKLEYAPVETEKPPMPLPGQYVLGMLSVPIYLAIAVPLGAPFRSSGRMWLLAAVFIMLVILVRVKLKWRAFIPGALTVVFLIPVGLVVFVWVTCGIKL